jgi:hypothetical protein
MPRYPLTSPAVLAFIVIPVVLVATFAWGVAAAWRRAGASPRGAMTAAATACLASSAWMAATWTLSARGVFLDFDRRPPRFALLVAAIVVLAIAIGRSAVGARLAALPLWALVGVQAFRLPLEIAMHGLAERGIMPDQMSYAGLNFDIVTGATAVVVAALVAAGRAGRRLVIWWNVLGLALLANIVAIAVASTPVFAAFGEDRLNTFVFHPPFVWLPAVMVLAALAGHLIVWRAAGRGAR